MGTRDLKADCDADQKLLPINEAIQKLIDAASSVSTSERLKLSECNGRILSEEIVSSVNVPPLDNSAMDGYAINTQDLEENNTLTVSQRIPAGYTGKPLEKGSAARIFTGASIPEGANAVVMQEVCEEADGKVVIQVKPSVGENIRYAGEDIRKGGQVLAKGHRMRAQDLGLIASVGVSNINVFGKVKVAILSTGDELKEPGELLEDGQIYNSNRYMLMGLLDKIGCECLDFGAIGDSLQSTRNALWKASNQADMIITTGGVSVGEEDHVKNAVSSLGSIDMWRMNIKPGKPLAFGYVNQTPFMGLPGNPVSVFATFHLFVRPFLYVTQGRNFNEDDSWGKAYQVSASFEWKRAGNRDEFVRVCYQVDESGNNVLVLYPNQSSGVLTSTSWATGFAYIPAGTMVEKGDKLSYLPFNEMLT